MKKATVILALVGLFNATAYAQQSAYWGGLLQGLAQGYLTRLGESGADPFTIQKMAGHSSIIVSQRYVHPTPERVEEAVSRLEEYNRKKVEELTADMQIQ